MRRRPAQCSFLWPQQYSRLHAVVSDRGRGRGNGRDGHLRVQTQHTNDRLRTIWSHQIRAELNSSHSHDRSISNGYHSFAREACSIFLHRTANCFSTTRGRTLLELAQACRVLSVFAVFSCAIRVLESTAVCSLRFGPRHFRFATFRDGAGTACTPKCCCLNTRFRDLADWAVDGTALCFGYTTLLHRTITSCARS